MTDLSIVLPGFPTEAYIRLMPSLEKNLVNTTDLLTLDAVEIAKRAQLPLLDVKRLCSAVTLALQVSLGVEGDLGNAEIIDNKTQLRHSGEGLTQSWNTISTLDDRLDAALGGGLATGYITEVTGESGAGKTQFLLSLLLATQLPAPRGMSKSALYISTESALPTTRLAQILRTHPILLAANPRPSLDRIISIVTPDLESQDHIIRYQLPVAIQRHNVGLVILDSVAANYRAEFERPGASRNGANMAKRSSELVKLGQLLRDLARTEHIAIIVANQVADRFSSPYGHGAVHSSPLTSRIQSSPLAHRGTGLSLPANTTSSTMIDPPSSLSAAAELGLIDTTDWKSSSDLSDIMTLDHQQQWFTGWGDHPRSLNMKTPSLGLVWTSQIACRIALIKQPVYGAGMLADEENERGETVLKKWRRWVKIVFAPWSPPSGAGLEGAVEFEITSQGIKTLGADEIEETAP